MNPDTILGWHRRLVAKKFDSSKNRQYPGRPQVDADIEELMVRVVSKNTNALKTGTPACLESLQNSPQGYTFVPWPIRPHSFCISDGPPCIEPRRGPHGEADARPCARHTRQSFLAAYDESRRGVGHRASLSRAGGLGPSLALSARNRSTGRSEASGRSARPPNFHGSRPRTTHSPRSAVELRLGEKRRRLEKDLVRPL